MKMECNEVESLLIDYLDAQLHPGDIKALEQHLHVCEACRQKLTEYKILFTSIAQDITRQPGPALREKFDIMLQSEFNIEGTTRILKEQEAGTIIKMRKKSLLLKIAASIILVTIGVLAGTQFRQGSTGNNTIQMADLRNELKDMKEVLLVTMLNQESASERIKAVSYADQIKDPDPRIINALLTTMNEDKNVNVRLAALNAIVKYGDTRSVSDSLVASLKRQTEPIMQIALINILTEKKETKAVGPIRDILRDKNTLQPVKDIAQKGLTLL